MLVGRNSETRWKVVQLTSGARNGSLDCDQFVARNAESIPCQDLALLGRQKLQSLLIFQGLRAGELSPDEANHLLLEQRDILQSPGTDAGRRIDDTSLRLLEASKARSDRAFLGSALRAWR